MEKGKVIKITSIKTGVSASGKSWSSCQLIIDNTKNQKFPSIGVFDVFGDQSIDAISSLKVGTEIQVEYNVNGFSYKDKNGTDVYASKLNYWKHEVLSYENPYEAKLNIKEEDLPF